MDTIYVLIYTLWTPDTVYIGPHTMYEADQALIEAGN